MKRFITALLFAICMLFALCACDVQIPELPELPFGEEDQTPTYLVSITLPKGVRVYNGSNKVKVKEGESARFELDYDRGYMFASISTGTYEYDDNAVVVNDVRANTNVTLTVNEYDFNTDLRYRFVLYGTGMETSNVSSGLKVNAGIVVNLKAEDMYRRFVGWSFNKSFGNGGTIVSSDREYSFVMNGDLADNLSSVVVYANYTDNNSIYYHPNGGTVNLTSPNCTHRFYYVASMANLRGEKALRLKISARYSDYAEAHSSLYDDGTFRRDGYVLTEYNTKPDGTGESFSLGSKVYFSPDDPAPTLYCIWQKETPVDKFAYTTYDMPRPVKSAYAPDWNARGVIITKYTGNDETLVIPEKIAGMPVIAIANGAIVGKDTKTIVLNRRIQKVENGAIKNCPALTTMYYPDSIYEMYNEALDAESTAGLSNIYVNAALAPRFASTLDGGHAIKLSRLLAGVNEPRIIAIGGSSIYEGLGTEYIEALLDGDYRFVNFGTTRTTHCTMYLEAMAYYADEDDVIVYAPENSSYLLGERELYWKSLRDLEGMVNIYRHVDMSKYTNFFSAFTDFNQNYRYKRAGVRYEDIVQVAYTDENGDHTRPERQGYVSDSRYTFVYYPSLNNRTKSRFDVNYKGDATANKEDYNNPNNETWCSLDDPYLLEPMNRIINAARSSGAKVYFGYCPCDADSLVEAAKNYEWLRAYDKLMAEIYDFDGIVGKCEDYIYNHMYFFDCAFHLNDYGRTYRTYQFYLDICPLLGREAKYGIYDLGRSFDGCLFENNSTGKPRVGVSYLTEG